ncbi:aat [Symbiodinium pilosum]|uniref:Aat protein n=1 Tax=Symbiodinium pilosum TaxID=2952 RepID=A0A812WWR7_SYMPI|nr:aat [Symbiodinium pilosum]
MSVAHAEVRKRAKAFRLSVNEAWSEVVANIQRHTWTSAPGDCWLSDKMAQAYKDVQSLGPKWLRGGMRFLSIELWHSQTGDLVAGEIGYTCGSIYSSCTGFSIKDKYPGAGCVQLAALGAWLAKQGFQIWDLGMELDYKLELGGQVVPRVEWASTIRRLRHQELALLSPQGDAANASSLLRILLPEQALSCELSGHLDAQGTEATGSTQKAKKKKGSKPIDDQLHESAPSFALAS